MRSPPCVFSVKYIKGTHQLADCLSRLGSLDDKIKFPTVQVHEITSRSQVTDSRIQLMHGAIAQDLIYVHSSTLCQLVGQSKSRKSHWRFRLTGISMGKSSLKMDFYLRDMNFQPHMPKTRSQATLCRLHWFIKLLAQNEANHILAWTILPN